VHILPSVEFLSPSDPPSLSNSPSHPSRVQDQVALGFLIPTGCSMLPPPEAKMTVTTWWSSLAGVVTCSLTTSSSTSPPPMLASPTGGGTSVVGGHHLACHRLHVPHRLNMLQCDGLTIDEEPERGHLGVHAGKHVRVRIEG
jgi:hypothetical protein